MDSQIPFFCGDSLECRTIGSSAALKGAIRNIQQKVGHLGLRIEKTKLIIAQIEIKREFINNRNRKFFYYCWLNYNSIHDIWFSFKILLIFLNLRNWNVWNSNLELNNFIFVKVSPESLAMFEKLETKVSFIIKDLQFVTVGVLEQLDVSLYVMECLMKDYMKVNKKLPKPTLAWHLHIFDCGQKKQNRRIYFSSRSMTICLSSSPELVIASSIFQGLSSIQRLENNHENSNSDKELVSEEVRRLLRSRLHSEYVLYDYVVSRLAVQRRRCDVRSGGEWSTWTLLRSVWRIIELIILLFCQTFIILKQIRKCMDVIEYFILINLINLIPISLNVTNQTPVSFPTTLLKQGF